MGQTPPLKPENQKETAMLAFIPLLVPLVPALIGACAGATAVAACHSSEDKDEKIRELKARVDALEKDRKP